MGDRFGAAGGGSDAGSADAGVVVDVDADTGTQISAPFTAARLASASVRAIR